MSNKQLTIFEKDYDGESLYDLERDVSESFNEDYNPVLTEIPTDGYGFQTGTFKVKIQCTQDET